MTLAGADEGDTGSLAWTRLRTELNLDTVSQDPGARKHLHPKLFSEVVTDKGYHSNEVLVDLKTSGIRSYISEPDRGRRDWKDKADAQQAVYANRRRIRGHRGQALRRKRGELLERPYAHLFETGGMRRLFLRHRQNILKRLLLHVCGFNLGLLMRKLVGNGTPRGMRGVFLLILSFITSVFTPSRRPPRNSRAFVAFSSHQQPFAVPPSPTLTFPKRWLLPRAARVKCRFPCRYAGIRTPRPSDREQRSANHVPGLFCKPSTRPLTIIEYSVLCRSRRQGAVACCTQVSRPARF